MSLRAAISKATTFSIGSNRSERSDADEVRLAALRTKLLAARAPRIRPGLDDKVLADWNGLMIAALANASWMLDEPAWLTMASGLSRSSRRR